jgi:hypothetical protein
VVDAVDDRRVDVLAAGRRDDDLLGPGLEVHAGLFLRREETRALEHDVDAELAPRQLRRVALRAHLDAVAADDERVSIDADLHRERTVRRVVACEVRVGFGVTEVVDGDDLNLVRALRLIERAQDVATDATVTVDCDFDGHGCLPRQSRREKRNYRSRLAAAMTASTVKPKC